MGRRGHAWRATQWFATSSAVLTALTGWAGPDLVRWADRGAWRPGDPPRSRGDERSTRRRHTGTGDEVFGQQPRLHTMLRAVMSSVLAVPVNQRLFPATGTSSGRRTPARP